MQQYCIMRHVFATVCAVTGVCRHPCTFSCKAWSVFWAQKAGQKNGRTTKYTHCRCILRSSRFSARNLGPECGPTQRLAGHRCTATESVPGRWPRLFPSVQEFFRCPLLTPTERRVLVILVRRGTASVRCSTLYYEVLLILHVLLRQGMPLLMVQY